MSLKLSKNKVNLLTKLIVDYLEKSEEVDYNEDIGNIRLKTYRIIMDELKLFEDQKDTIKLSALVSNVIDKETQEKIEIIRGRLIKSYAYCDVCSKDILEYISSVFARGDEKEE